MKRLCAWCGMFMGEKPPFGGLEDKFSNQVTHGICNDCMHIANEDIREEWKERDKEGK